MPIFCKPFFEPSCQKCELFQFVGVSDTSFEIILKINSIAQLDAPVLLTGDSGTGKELLARAIHFCKRGLAPQSHFVKQKLNDSELLSLMNREKQAEIFQSAEGGTLFLDEISDLSLDMQRDLLRLIEEKQPFPLETKAPNSIRLIASSNQNILKMVQENHFRKDLYYRLNTFHVHIPPLRKRKADITALVFHILDRLAKKKGVEHYRIHMNVLKAFLQYDWPGNIRELENILLQEVSYLKPEENELKNIPGIMAYQKQEIASQGKKHSSEIKPLWLVEKETITAALKAFNGNRNKSAQTLQISRNTLYRKISDYNIFI